MNIMFFLTPKSETIFAQINSSLRQVMEKINKHRLSAIPIIDDQGRYLATVMEGDILARLFEDKNSSFESIMEERLDDLTLRRVHKSIQVDATFEEVVDLSLKQNFVPVVDDNGTYIGIIKRADVIGHLYHSLINKP